jgi:hypothetical protein
MNHRPGPGLTVYPITPTWLHRPEKIQISDAGSSGGSGKTTSFILFLNGNMTRVKKDRIVSLNNVHELLAKLRDAGSLDPAAAQPGDLLIGDSLMLPKPPYFHEVVVNPTAKIGMPTVITITSAMDIPITQHRVYRLRNASNYHGYADNSRRSKNKALKIWKVMDSTYPGLQERYIQRAKTTSEIRERKDEGEAVVEDPISLLIDAFQIQVVTESEVILGYVLREGQSPATPVEWNKIQSSSVSGKLPSWDSVKEFSTGDSTTGYYSTNAGKLFAILNARIRSTIESPIYLAVVALPGSAKSALGKELMDMGIIVRENEEVYSKIKPMQRIMDITGFPNGKAPMLNLSEHRTFTEVSDLYGQYLKEWPEVATSEFKTSERKIVVIMCHTFEEANSFRFDNFYAVYLDSGIDRSVSFKLRSLDGKDTRGDEFMSSIFSDEYTSSNTKLEYGLLRLTKAEISIAMDKASSFLQHPLI